MTASKREEKLTCRIKAIKDLPFEDFVMPEYQRPYKWGVRNVNQLTSDLLRFKDGEEYGLGSA